MSMLKHTQIVMGSGDLDNSWNDWPLCYEIRAAVLGLRQKDRLTEQQDIVIVAQHGRERHSNLSKHIDD